MVIEAEVVVRMDVSDNKTIEEQFDGFFSREQREMETLLPAEITETYKVVSLIGETKLHTSYLLEDKKQRFRVLLKTGRDEAIPLLKTEANVGEKVRSALKETDGRVISYQEIDGTGYLLRQYIEGMNLIEYVERREMLVAEEIYDIMHILSQKISTLHELNPPIIHRDIKPENIIVRAKKGRIIDVYIIDYGTARMYDENKEHDTVFVGTRQTAAPEQYGFSQTDERTDVYGLGKVLCYMLTGSYDAGRLKDISGGMRSYMKLSSVECRSLCRAAAKATEIDPGKRYLNIRQFEAACFRGHRFRRYGVWVAGIAVFAVMIAAAFLSGIKMGEDRQKSQHDGDLGTDVGIMNEESGRGDLSGSGDESAGDDASVDAKDLSKDTNEAAGKNAGNKNPLDVDDEGEVIFQSELMREAVEMELPEGTKITEEALSQVRSIRIIGNKCCEYNTEIWAVKDCVYVDGMAVSPLDSGDVSDLSVIKYMDHLEELYIPLQNITDISALEGCPVKTLFLNGNEITDFSVLATMPNLESLYIGNTPISDLPDLSQCENLNMLNIDYLILNDLEPLRNTGITDIEILGTRVLDNDYSVLKDMGTLRRLTMDEPESGMMDVVGELTTLSELSVATWPYKNIEKVSTLTNLKILSLSSSKLQNLSGIEALQKLEILDLFPCSVLSDASGIEKLPRLQHFKCEADNIEDITPICSLPNSVSTVILSKGLLKRVLEVDPDFGKDRMGMEEYNE